MFYVLIAIHSIICLSLIGLVMIQQGKGADAGAALGGGGAGSFFGAAGAADFMTKLTTGLAIAFMASSVLLVRYYQNDYAQLIESREPDPAAGSAIVDQLDRSAVPEVGSDVPEVGSGIETVDPGVVEPGAETGDDTIPPNYADGSEIGEDEASKMNTQDADASGAANVDSDPSADAAEAQGEVNN